jgi:hypothetical protein
MANIPPANGELERQLTEIKGHLQVIRHDVSSILHALRDELDAFREREFWRDYGETFQKE